MRILVVRNDKLGDFMLTWPAFARIRRSFPQARIIALVPAYTAPMAQLCPDIDEIVLDPGKEAGIDALVQALRAARADALITLFSTGRVAIAAWRAGIPYRLAPATKLAQFLYNHRLVQRRSRSEKPEWAYNLDLAERFCRDFGQIPAPVSGPYLRFPAEETAQLRKTFCQRHGLDDNTRLVFIHPGSGGSASNLNEAQYAALAQALSNLKPLSFVISAGPGEEEKARDVLTRMGKLPATLYASSDGLPDFARHIAFADLFISGSTGPLHIAGALDVPTAAFYPLRRSATALRWQTTNTPGRHLAFSPPAGTDDMARIDVAAAARDISARLLGPG